MRDRFRAAGLPTAELDARLLAQLALGIDRLGLLSQEQEPIRADDLTALGALADRRMAGEPVARIIGEQEFYGLSFVLNSATLIPRPETELLVDLVLEHLEGRAEPWVLDLGTGTGCIPISILANHPQAQSVAVDLSRKALEAARINAQRHRVSTRMTFVDGSWFSPLQDSRKFDAIVSNPPYIESETIAGLQAEVREFDPVLALDGGPDGLTAYRNIARDAGKWLTPGGGLFVEVGSQQAADVSDILRSAGFSEVTVKKDLAGLDRVVMAHHFLA